MKKNDLWLLIWVIAFVAFGLIFWRIRFLACVEKFPDAPTWACLV